MAEFGIFENINKDLYFIGDIHGDFYAFKQALELTGCIIFDKQNFKDICKEHLNGIILTDGCEYYKNKINWNPEKKDSMIVFAGDLVDRCRITSDSCDFVVNDEDCDNQIINILLELDKQALKYNSRVLFVLGNHELMNLQDKLKYVSFKGLENNSRTGNIKKTIFSNLNSIFGLIRINNYIVCHGGINPNFVKKYNTDNTNNSEFVKSYNMMLRKELTNSEPNYYLLNNSQGPFWDRSNGFDNKKLSNEECELLFFNNILNITNINNTNNLKLIVAHCPQTFNSEKKGINTSNCGKYQNRIWRIDVSMSRAFDMYISDSNVINILLDKIINKNQSGGNIGTLEIAALLGIGTLLYANNTNNNINNINIIDFYVNRDKELNKVQILKINKNNTEEIIKGIISLEYFYNTVFSEQDARYKYLYLLQDMYVSFSRGLNSSYNLEMNILNKIQEIKTKLFLELYPRDNKNTTIIQLK